MAGLVCSQQYTVNMFYVGYNETGKQKMLSLSILNDKVHKLVGVMVFSMKDTTEFWHIGLEVSCSKWTTFITPVKGNWATNSKALGYE